MNLHSIITSSPINSTAKNVISQSNAVLHESDLTRDELIYIVSRLQRKMKLLKFVLGINNRSQHKNMMWKANKHVSQFRVRKEPRSFNEYRRVGQEIQRLNLVIKELKSIFRGPP